MILSEPSTVGDLLVRRGLLRERDAERLAVHGSAARAASAAVESGLVQEEALLQALADELGWDYVDLASAEIRPEALAELPAREIARRQALPLGFEGRRLRIAIGDPFDLDGLEELRLLVRRPLRFALTRREELRLAIKDRVGLGGGTLEEIAAKASVAESGEPEDDETLANEASIMRLVHELISDACSRRASDIHLEPTPDGLTVRYRMDGLLHHETASTEINRFRSAIISRVKIMARLNIAERRLPQDGRIRLKLPEGELDVRVSIIPMLHGEGVVLRLLDPRRGTAPLAALDFPDALAARFEKLIRSSHGIILVTGPTGSGKTTTLYSALAHLRGPERKIVTIEDPVEYELEGINQIHVHAKVGLTFAAGLRSVLRHDPDVILVGEIRDAETARSAIQAAMTGHLVFSTLHTNDAPSAYARLIDMGIEPYLAAGGIIGVLAQRLVRRLCPHCRVAYAPCDADLPRDFPRPLPESLWRAAGCRECRYTGYAGRVAIFELVRSDAALREACLRQRGLPELYAAASRSGYVPLRGDGWQKTLRGVTSIEEVTRVTGLDDEQASEATGA